jgi:hypothetical protein
MTKQETAKQAYESYKGLVKRNREAEQKMLELLLHPDCPDEMALQVVKARREATNKLRQSKEPLLKVMYAAGLTREANYFAATTTI